MRRFDPLISQGAFALAAAVFVILTLLQGYVPSVNGCKKDKMRLQELSEQISQLGTMVTHSGGPEVWLSRNQERLHGMQRRFATHEELPKLLDALMDVLAQGAITVLDVEQDNLEPVKDAGGVALIGGRPCYRQPIHISAVGRYNALLSTLSGFMDTTFPSVASIEEISLKRYEATSVRLKADVRLYLYVVGTSGAPVPDA